MELETVRLAWTDETAVTHAVHLAVPPGRLVGLVAEWAVERGIAAFGLMFTVCGHRLPLRSALESDVPVTCALCLERAGGDAVRMAELLIGQAREGVRP